MPILESQNQKERAPITEHLNMMQAETGITGTITYDQKPKLPTLLNLILKKQRTI